MKDSFRNLMLNVQRLTRSGRLAEATAAIQRALGGIGAARTASPRPQAPPVPPGAARGFGPNPFDAAAMRGEVIDVEARVIDEAQPDPPLTDFVESLPNDDALMPPPAEPRVQPTPHDTTPPGGEFLAATYSCAAGGRDYKLYRPSGVRNGALLPLVVMLHGCKQNPDDFAAGTRMNQLAEEHGWLVLYPAQSRAVNRMGCWNWFKAEDQQRERGEPAIIAGMTRHIVQTRGADPKRVYVAGLSAGGAMADIMATTYPDIFAAAGIHSGLAHAAAHDLMSALNAMRQGPRPRSAGSAPAPREPVPTIVFHGDSDATVHPSNGERVVAQARSAGSAGAAGPGVRIEQGEVAGGRRFTRTIERDASGRCSTEHWVVHGAGHAWSGGHPSGSYTDPLGPDASAQMLRFFLEHPKVG